VWTISRALQHVGGTTKARLSQRQAAQHGSNIDEKHVRVNDSSLTEGNDLVRFHLMITLQCMRCCCALLLSE